MKKLAPAWIFWTGDYAENLQAAAIVDNGAIYIITPRAQVFALDAATGQKGLFGLTAPIVRVNVATPMGVKDLIVIAGASGKLFVVYRDSGTIYWEKTLSTATKTVN